MDDWALLIEAAKAINAAAQQSGWIAGLATALIFGIRVLRLGIIQDLLPPALQWSSWAAWLRWLLPFALAAVGTFALDFTAGMGLYAALTAAFAAGTAAVAGHHVTKAIGHVEQDARLMRNPFYRPSTARKIAGLVLPVKSKNR